MRGVPWSWGGEGEGDVLGLGPRVADSAYLGIGDLDVPWPLWVYCGPPDVYRGPPEVYRGPCMKITPLNRPIISTSVPLRRHNPV